MRALRVILVGLCVLVAALDAWGGSIPVAVSPGDSANVSAVESRCPTFSWGEAEGAELYELRVYRTGETGEQVEVILRKTLPGSAESWTPSLAHCLEHGGRYAWTVRAVTREEAGAWSEPMLFETAAMPSDGEVRHALEVLRRYRQIRDSEAGDNTAGSVTADRVATSVHDLEDLRGSLVEGAEDRAGGALSSPTVGVTPSFSTVLPPPSFSLTIDGDFDLGGAVFQGGTAFIHADGGGTYSNTAVGLDAFVSATPGVPDFFYGSRNSAFGNRALRENTSGYENTASGFKALYANVTGNRNAATGARALAANTDGSDNTAVGRRTLEDNTTGFRNTATGAKALDSNLDGFKNTATGFNALGANISGYQNTASGAFAMFLTTGNDNTATGDGALFSNTTGNYNTAFGAQAGSSWTTGNDNIALGRGSQGVAGETGTIRIGGGGYQTRTFIAGIYGSPIITPTHYVVVDANGQVGQGPALIPSSRRFKEEIASMDDSSRRLLDLHPVTFRFKDEFQRGDPSLQFGLIAEEVDHVLPEVVVHDSAGRPERVDYRKLTPMLLNEVQRLHRRTRMQAWILAVMLLAGVAVTVVQWRLG